MKRLLFVIIASIVVAGCTNPIETQPNPDNEIIPGQIEVKFGRNVVETDAYALLEKLSFRAIDFRNFQDDTKPNWTIVGVPEGKEKYWSFRITHYPIVASARPHTTEASP